ncbi:MAG: FtsQ-type POTRA domain-containing protein [Andreesenia angusta]|nr:FtsQ-type POTRA domain-containing protein [Andreesenia angusta]
MEGNKKRIKRKEKKLKKLRLIKSIFILLCIFIIIYIFFTKLPLFSIKNISVKNNEKIQDNQIVKSSGLVLGENIFKIDKEKIYANLKSKEPYIESVEVKRRLPNTIFLNINEKKDIYTIIFGKKRYFIGKEAIPLSEMNMELDDKNDDNDGIPILNGLKIEKMIIGEPIKISNKNIDEKEFRKFSAGISRESIRAISKEIEINENSEVSIKVSDYQTIKLGKFNNMEYKTDVLDRILKDLKKKKIQFKTIDFTKSKKVVVEKLSEKDLEDIENKKNEGLEEEIKEEVNEEEANEEIEENSEGNNNYEISDEDKEIEKGTEEEKVNQEEDIENPENNMENE